MKIIFQVYRFNSVKKIDQNMIHIKSPITRE